VSSLIETSASPSPSFDLEALRREEFPAVTAGDTVFLNHASTGPLPTRSIAALDEWSRRRANPTLVSQELQFGTLARSRQHVAHMIGAKPSEIALATNTTFGINLAAFSLPLKRGDVVLSPDLEFPANVYPWMQLAERRGIEYRRLECDDGVLHRDRLERELEDERVKLVTVSWVQFASGARVDLAALGALCHERGVYFVVDAIKGLGPLKLDMSKTHVDILACGAQMWLLSPWGAAFVYVRQPLIEQLEPHDVSWMSVEGSDDFTRLTNYDLKWRQDARRFEFVTLPYQDYAGMNASLELFKEVGFANVARYAQRLGERIVNWAVTRDDVELVTPADPRYRAAVIAVRPIEALAASRRLSAAGVVHSFREGAIRLSPHFYNNDDEIDRALALIAL
jgi:selenocysteine lyase/cysteine desulfurase